MSGKNEPRERATAFLSYAREDRQFVLALARALEEHGVEPVGDWLLTPGQNYELTLREMSMSSHALIFIITPDSIRSEACRNELALAVESRKQVLPVSHRDHGDDNRLDSALRAPQWIFLRDGDDFARGVEELVKGINTDFALMEMHGRLLLAAENWKNNGRNRSYLLRKDGLREAEAWLARTSVQPEKLPQPTPLEVEFILAGQRARGRGTRIAIGLALAVVISLSILSIVALAARSTALRQKAIADDRFTRLSVANGSRLLEADDLPGALLWFAHPLAIDPQDEPVLRQRLAATRSVHPRLVQLMAHDARISDVQLSGARDRLMTSSGGTIRSWDPRTGTLVWSRPAGAEKATALALSHDGTAYAIVSPRPHDDQRIREFLATAQEAGIPTSADPQLIELLVPLSEVRLVDGATGRLRTRAVLAVGENTRIWALRDATFILSGSAGGFSSDARTLLWRPGRTPAVRQISAFPYEMVSVSPGGRILLAGSFGGPWLLLGNDGTTIATGRHELSVHSESLTSAALSPDGSRLATADSTGKVFLWDAGTATPIGSPLQIGPGRGHALVFSPDGRWLATAGEAITLWNVATRERRFRQERRASRIAFSPSGRYLLSLGEEQGEGELRVWDAVTGAAVSPPIRSVFRAEWSGDDRTIITAGNDHTLKVWDIFPTPTMLSLSQQQSLGAGVFSADGQVVVAPAQKGLQRLTIDRFDRVDPTAAERPGSWRRKFAIDAAGSLRIEIADYAATAFGRDGRPLPTFHHKMSYVSAARISKDGNTVLLAGGGPDDGQVVVWNASTGQARIPPLEHDDYVGTASFSPDGRRIVSASRDGTARIWSVANGSLLRRLDHDGGVHDAVFNTAGDRIATAAADSGVRIWNTATGELAGPVVRLEGPARLVRFSPDDAVDRCNGAGRIGHAALGHRYTRSESSSRRDRQNHGPTGGSIQSGRKADPRVGRSRRFPRVEHRDDGSADAAPRQ